MAAITGVLRPSSSGSALAAGSGLQFECACGRQIAFVPDIGAVPTGATMTVTPVVSADRRYVRLSVNAFFNDLNGFTTFPVLGAAGGGGGAGAFGGVGGYAGMNGVDWTERRCRRRTGSSAGCPSIRAAEPSGRSVSPSATGLADWRPSPLPGEDPVWRTRP